MFNLENAMTDWRRHMLAAGVKTPVPLEELESHLREEVERRVKSGADEAQAFALAVQCIGQPAALRHEFTKAGAIPTTRLRRWKAAFFKFLGLPVFSPDFASESREALELGGREALGFHHDFIGTEHVLLGLLGLKAGIIPGVMEEMGIDPKIVRSEIEKVVGQWSVGQSGRPLRYTPRALKALDLAGKQARAMQQSHVGAGHILLGLLQEGSGVAALVLKKLGVNLAAARQEILRAMSQAQAGA